METLKAPDRSPMQDPYMVKLKTFLINAVAHEFNQVTSTPAERDALVKESLNKAYEQTNVKLPESIRKELFHDILDVCQSPKISPNSLYVFLRLIGAYNYFTEVFYGCTDDGKGGGHLV